MLHQLFVQVVLQDYPRVLEGYRAVSISFVRFQANITSNVFFFKSTLLTFSPPGMVHGPFSESFTFLTLEPSDEPQKNT